MKLMLCIAVVCIIWHSAVGDPTPDEVSRDEDWRKPRMIGVNRGKEFAVGLSTGSWHYSVMYCYKLGYIPAMIEDRKDLMWLAHNSSLIGFGLPLWTSGTDLPVSRLFTWYHTRNAVDKALKPKLADPLKRCLALNLTPINRPSLYDEYCLAGRAYPLCEKRIP